MHWRSLIISTTLALATGACATAYQVKIDSIAESAAPAAKKYVLASGMADVRENDLYFREFAEHFRRVLANKGLSEVGTRAEADMEVMLAYGSSNGRAEMYTYTRPLYYISGGEQVTYREIRTDAGGQKIETTGTVYIPLRTQFFGYTTEMGSQTVYTSYAVLEARTIAPADAAPTQLWKTTIRLTDASNDLRHLLPYMATAAAPYVATNTGTVVNVDMQRDDPRVRAIVPPAP